MSLTVKEILDQWPAPKPTTTAAPAFANFATISNRLAKPSAPPLAAANTGTSYCRNMDHPHRQQICTSSRQGPQLGCEQGLEPSLSCFGRLRLIVCWPTA
uniref:Uncharacterized protein n=1 Tax=Cyclophora tenuis TaxID=216820 RepID=A0A7S1D674_CYCTE